MIKVKAINSFSKRFRKTASGNFKYKHANLRHILTKKSSKRKRNLRHKSMLSRRNKHLVLDCLPYL